MAGLERLVLVEPSVRRLRTISVATLAFIGVVALVVALEPVRALFALLVVGAVAWAGYWVGVDATTAAWRAAGGRELLHQKTKDPVTE